MKSIFMWIVAFIAVYAVISVSLAVGNRNVNRMNLSMNTKPSIFRQIIGGTLLSLSLTSAVVLAPSTDSQSFKVNAAESVFVGKYSDPFHPGCLRKIEETKNEIVITGSDDPKAAKLWVIKAKSISPTELLVDFSPKGGPPDLLGKYNAKMNAIQWPDGNAWTKSL